MQSGVSPIEVGAEASVSFMRHLCMRPACNGPAVVLVIMNHNNLTFTVRDPGEIDGPGRVALCEVHLDRMKAPQGWDILDERPGGDVVAFVRPASSMGNLIDPTPVAPRPVIEATHPLRNRLVSDDDAESSESAPEPARTPLLARAFLGVDRHPASPIGSADDIDWDQRDLLGEDDDEQISLDDFEPDGLDLA